MTLLSLERLEKDLFRGQSQDLGWGTVFGGQVLGQALSAAVQTVASDRPVHSLHAYFLRPGDVHHPIIYDVDRIRDGSSFTTRRVVAIQHGEPIFHLSASFQVVEDGLEHQDAMPKHPGPDGLVSEHDIWARLAKRLPEPQRSRATSRRPVELFPVDPVDPIAPDKRPPDHAVWLKTAAPLRASSTLSTQALSCALLAYCSDFTFLTTALRPHQVTWATSGMQVASLDHVMWFHRPFAIDDWLLHVIHSPSAAAARGLVTGSVYTRDGVLVCTTAQEGLMRQRLRAPT